MITHDDVFIALSYSGEANELMSIAPIIKRMGTKLIAMTGRPDSSLAQLADVHLNVHVEKEACPTESGTDCQHHEQHWPWAMLWQ